MLSLRGLPHTLQIHMLELVNVPIMQMKELRQGLFVIRRNLKNRVAELKAGGKLSCPGL